MISSGNNHSAMVTTEGQLFMCGSYLHEKLGINDLTTNQVSKFTLCSNMVGKKVRKVACGDFHTVALLTVGSVHAWGGSLHKRFT